MGSGTNSHCPGPSSGVGSGHAGSGATATSAVAGVFDAGTDTGDKVVVAVVDGPAQALRISDTPASRVAIIHIIRILAPSSRL